METVYKKQSLFERAYSALFNTKSVRSRAELEDVIQSRLKFFETLDSAFKSKIVAVSSPTTPVIVQSPVVDDEGNQGALDVAKVLVKHTESHMTAAKQCNANLAEMTAERDRLKNDLDAASSELFNLINNAVGSSNEEAHKNMCLLHNEEIIKDEEIDDLTKSFVVMKQGEDVQDSFR